MDIKFFVYFQDGLGVRSFENEFSNIAKGFVFTTYMDIHFAVLKVNVNKTHF